MEIQDKKNLFVGIHCHPAKIQTPFGWAKKKYDESMQQHQIAFSSIDVT